ncbi:ACT domain-containing protein [Leucothrix arctica]|uniref:ACT domain-containing protein n=1 Tax=Leucothrix arctica TaxID=1481894 RepID=A0A317CL44_9GAMM|nr:ACT domain-containing protein [Leucothrix arctica]PWQ99258.1 ACT domain-containing protein [Leucothrix arctica]
MTNITRNLSVLPDYFAVCQLTADADIPQWGMPRKASFFAVTQTLEELSLICPQQCIPEGAHETILIDRDWRCLKLEGPFALDEPGVMVSIVKPLSDAGISVFAEATYNTDYLIVNKLGKAIEVLEALGHHIINTE